MAVLRAASRATRRVHHVVGVHRGDLDLRVREDTRRRDEGVAQCGRVHQRGPHRHRRQRQARQRLLDLQAGTTQRVGVGSGAGDGAHHQPGHAGLPGGGQQDVQVRRETPGVRRQRVGVQPDDRVHVGHGGIQATLVVEVPHRHERTRGSQRPDVPVAGGIGPHLGALGPKGTDERHAEGRVRGSDEHGHGPSSLRGLGLTTAPRRGPSDGGCSA